MLIFEVGFIVDLPREAFLRTLLQTYLQIGRAPNIQWQSVGLFGSKSAAASWHTDLYSIELRAAICSLTFCGPQAIGGNVDGGEFGSGSSVGGGGGARATIAALAQAVPHSCQPTAQPWYLSWAM